MFPCSSSAPRKLSGVLLDFLFTAVVPAERLRTASMCLPSAALKLSLTWAFTTSSFASFGSWTNRALGGWSPVVAYLRHSITVVLPLPLGPTMTVTGELNSTAEKDLSSNERMPCIASRFRLVMVDVKKRVDRRLMSDALRRRPMELRNQFV